MPFEITPKLADDKAAILDYFRHRGEESMEDVTRQFAVSEAKPRAGALNTAVKESRDTLVSSILQQAQTDKWPTDSVLRCVLLSTYASYVSMIDLRNAVWSTNTWHSPVESANCGSRLSRCVSTNRSVPT